MARRRREGIGFFGVMFRLVLVIAVLAGLGLVAYAVVGDLAPERARVERPVTLDGR
jgi:hypothetical protein